MATARLTHIQREQVVLTALEASFPNFTGKSLTWTKVQDGQDPPDFLSNGPDGTIGLELIEWLDGDQMGPAKGRESQRDNIRRVLTENWEVEYQPKIFNLAVTIPDLTLRITRSEEAQVRKEFFACAAIIDRTWRSNPERLGRGYLQTDFTSYPLLQKYFGAIRYIGGELHGLCWIDVEEDGGAFDPAFSMARLEQALDKKLTLYSTPGAQTKLKAHGVMDLYLLVHGGFNAYRYNTPSGPLSLDQIVGRGAGFYAAHSRRQTFNRVWFFDSLDSADEINQLFGHPPGSGRVRWLAQLFPDFNVDPRSLAE